MVTKNLLTRMLLLIALVVGSVTSVWAEDVTASFMVTGLSSVPSSFSSTPAGFTMTVAKNGGTEPAQNNGSLRLYAKNQMTIYSTNGTTKFKSVTFSMKINAISGKYPLISAPSGSFSPEVTDNKATTTTWTAPTGGVTTITFTFPANSSGVGGNWTFSNVSVTYEASSDPSSAVTFADTTPSINFPGTTTYSQEATTATGYTGTVNYEITANTAGATISGSTVTVTQEGSVTVKATAPAIEGSFAASTASYTLTVNDTRSDSGLAFAESSQTVEIGETLTAPTITNPNGLSVTYSSDDEDVATVDASGNVTGVAAGTATITASFDGNNDYKAGNASYVVTVVVPVTPVNGYYKKVTSTTDITDGQYLIVYEDGEVAFNGGLNTLDGENNTISVEIATDETIAATTLTQGAEFTIEKEGNATTYTVKSASGYYIGQSSDSNGMKADEEKRYSHSISINSTYDADLVSNSAHLRFNSSSNQLRFRYYKSSSYTGQKAIQLYKFVEEAVSPTATITSAGYATFSNENALDFSANEDLTVYTATDNGTKVTLNEVTTKKVPANTPVVLKGAVGDYPATVISEAAELGANDLHISDGTTAMGDDIYVLANKSNGVGFYKWAGGGSLSAGKIYLKATSNAPFLGFGDDGETTGINPSLTLPEGEGTWYDLSGRRVAQPTKGVFIKNGKKVLVP